MPARRSNAAISDAGREIQRARRAIASSACTEYTPTMASNPPKFTSSYQFAGAHSPPLPVVWGVRGTPKPEAFMPCTSVMNAATLVSVGQSRSMNCLSPLLVAP